MISSKNHNGSSFIEMMAALALLAIFGTSLFLVQTSLLEKLFKTHVTVINMLEIDKHLLQFNQTMQQALADQKPIESITLHHANQNPEYTIDIKIKTLPKSSKFAKRFGTDVGFVQTTIKQDRYDSTWYNFAYTKAPKKEEKQNKPEAKQS